MFSHHFTSHHYHYQHFLSQHQHCFFSLILFSIGARVPLNGGICGYAAKIGRIVNLQSAHADWRFDPSLDTRPGIVTRSLLMVPVRTRKGATTAILEAINCTRTEPNYFTVDDETIM